MALDVVVCFTADEHAAVAEHADALEIPLDAYVRQSTARRAKDWQLKQQLLAQAAQQRDRSGEPFVIPGTLIDEEKEARAREAARECGIEYTDEVRGIALWGKIQALHSDLATRNETARQQQDRH
ncbi:hypothetical protein ABCR94_02000 [Streptomyces sp. 21So2-11]|uniref:hypothetical protein n=1 Tax=Streptomyces sp. 21So2-11 TaxID=3144408 RepID=UPI00321B0FD1